MLHPPAEWEGRPARAGEGAPQKRQTPGNRPLVLTVTLTRERSGPAGAINDHRYDFQNPFSLRTQVRLLRRPARDTPRFAKATFV